MFGYGVALGVLIGLGAATVLLRYGMALGEKTAWGRREGVPVLHAFDAPLEQASTAGDEDLETQI